MEGKCGETVRIKGGEDRYGGWWCWLAWILKEFYSETSIFSVKQGEKKRMERCLDFRENKKKQMILLVSCCNFKQKGENSILRIIFHYFNLKIIIIQAQKSSLPLANVTKSHAFKLLASSPHNGLQTTLNATNRNPKSKIGLLFPGTIAFPNQEIEDEILGKVIRTRISFSLHLNIISYFSILRENTSSLERTE